MADPATPQTRYDAVTITSHWITALLVFVLLGTSFGWKYLPRSWNFKQFEGLHISLGIALAAVIVARLLWRLFAGRKLHGTGSMVTDLLSKLMHIALYILVVAQVVLGFALRWFQGEEFSFFGLFSIPSLVQANRGLEHQVENLHSLNAWAILILVGGHSVAALFHRYVLKDGVLRRMLPIAG
jgi:cytochrome b561